MDGRDDRRLHDALDFVGLRAQATAVAVLQLCAELRRAGVLDDEAIRRIKEAIAKEIALSRPRSVYRQEFDTAMRRLDDLFAGRAQPKATLAEEQARPTP